MAITAATSTRISITNEGMIEVTITKTFTDDSDNSVGSVSKNLAFSPDTAIADLPGPKLKKIANAVWDAQTIADWKAAHPPIVQVPAPVVP